LSGSTLALITVPFFTGAIGYVTNWTGVLMLFYPVHFRGWRARWLEQLALMLPRKLQQIPGLMIGGIGWQGIVPSRADRRVLDPARDVDALRSHGGDRRLADAVLRPHRGDGAPALVRRTALRHIGGRLARLDRRRLPHWVIVRAVPIVIGRRFDADSAAELEARFELRIRHPHGREPASFALDIARGQCSVRPGPARDAGATALVGADDLILLASGAANWPELLSSGRFQLSGDPFLALRFASLFRLPVRLEV
jgi:SCP-2 sterol transfer family